MPDLPASLHKHDLGHLHIVAGFWGLELESHDADSAAEELCAAILDADTVRETIEILPPNASAALTALMESNGKMEWAIFARKYGEIREMGEARRDRERPHLKPISASEILFYRGLLEKAFFDTDKGAQEFGYVPDDIFEIIKHDVREDLKGENQEPLGRPATPIEKAYEIPATDHILDDATTYLAALRAGRSNRQFDLRELLTAASILKKDELQAEAVKKFLEASREDALGMLHSAWLKSQTFDELRLIPTIICEGEWLRQNQPQVTREFLMNLVNDIPQNKWWSLPAFLRDLKTKFPDFQRPAGDYDSWFIKRESDGQYLRGFAYWDQVDGALVKYFIQMLHWLGEADLAAPEEGKEFTAFRVKLKVEGSRSNNLQPSTFDGKLTVASSGKIVVARNFSRAVRYQISRFCEWDDEKNNEYAYHVTAKSLKQAGQQGLKAEQLLALLVKYTKGSVPPALVKALKQWDAHGVEARVETQTLLRVARPEIVEELRKSKAGKFLSEALSPTAVIIKSGAESKVLEALTELGLLAEIGIMKDEL
jgi:hypothetical protein